MMRAIARGLSSLLLPEFVFRRLYRVPVLIIVDGNIGSGKSTLIQSLSDRLAEYAPVVLAERVDEWLKLGLLQMQYDAHQPSRVRSGLTCAFQIMGPGYDGIVRRQKIANERAQIILQERCSEASTHVFLKACSDPEFRASEIHEDHAERIRALLDHLDADKSITRHVSTLRVCLEASPDTCLARVQQRNRNGEEGISHGDLGILAHLYGEFWNQKEADPRECVLRLDAGLSVQELTDLVIQKIRL